MSGKINPSGLCVCECGEETSAATVTGRGYKKGDSRKYVNGHNLKKDGRPSWRGGVGIANGYTRVKNPTHPRADTNGYVAEHILVAEKAFGGPLPPKAVIHHVNKDKTDNRPDNLVICDTKYHFLLHRRARALEATGNPDARKCSYCKGWGVDLRVRKSGESEQAEHVACELKYQRDRRAAKKAANIAKEDRCPVK